MLELRMKYYMFLYWSVSYLDILGKGKGRNIFGLYDPVACIPWTSNLAELIAQPSHPFSNAEARILHEK